MRNVIPTEICSHEYELLQHGRQRPFRSLARAAARPASVLSRINPYTQLMRQRRRKSAFLQESLSEFRRIHCKALTKFLCIGSL